MTLEEFIIEVYCGIEERLKRFSGKVRRAGFAPSLSDSEALTIEVVGEFLGMQADKKIWEYFKTHYREWFPKLGSRSSFVRQCSGLLPIKQRLLAELFAIPRSDILHMTDGVPIPVIHLARSRRDRCFKGEAAYGYCASKDQHYYGFLGSVTIDSEGSLSGFSLTPANAGERETLLANSAGIAGLMLADKGFISQPLKEKLGLQGIQLQTPLRNNMTDGRNPAFIRWIISTRRLVETVIGQLTERFRINAIKVKDFWHLQARIARKLLAHSIASTIAKSHGFRPTQLDALLTT